MVKLPEYGNSLKSSLLSTHDVQLAVATLNTLGITANINYKKFAYIAIILVMISCPSWIRHLGSRFSLLNNVATQNVECVLILICYSCNLMKVQ